MPPLTQSSAPDGSAGRPMRSFARGVRRLRSPWTLVAITMTIILLGVYFFLTTSLSCAVTSYTSETTSDGNIALNVTVRNYGLRDQTVMLRSVVDLQNDTFHHRYQQSITVQLHAGEERTIPVTIKTDLEPPAPDVLKAYCFVLPSR